MTRRKIPANAAECLTLREYREYVLRLTQAEVAGAVCKQAWISMVERGHLPRPKSWPKLLKSYRLEGLEQDFYRMVVNARKQAELLKPLAATHPLFASGTNRCAAVVESLGGGATSERKAARA